MSMSIAGARAVAFDLDDTLTDWHTGISRAAAAAALLTNNPFGGAVLERHGLHADVFDCVVVADPCTRKPDPRAFTLLTERLGLAHREIAYVGDSITADVEGARDAGLRPVWLDRWNDAWPVPPGVVRVASLLELLELFD